jgi:hypothetical protein
MLFQATTAEQTDSEASEGIDPTFRVETSPDGKAYFPKGKESYYTEYFRAAKLPSMQFMREEKGKVRFRLAILPSFSKPLFLTYSRGDKGATIEIKRLNLLVVNSSTEPGEVELTGEVVVGERIARVLEDAVIIPKVRQTLGELTERQRLGYLGFDGVTFILEVSTDTDYTMEDLWSPESIGNTDPEILKKFNLPKVDTKPFIEFRDYLLKITDMKIPFYRAIDLLDNG